jgi:aminopeptidase C
MKKIGLLCLTLLLTLSSAAQEYVFTPVVENKATPVKNQGRTGTCWCFGTLSFLESELLRMGIEEVDLSEMYTVRQTYKLRYFDNYLRRGKGNLGPGGVCHTATLTSAQFGLMPESAYPGIAYDSPGHNHSELGSYVEAIAKVPDEAKNMSPESEAMLNAVLDIYLGETPSSFTYKGKDFTPASFASYLGLDMDNYVEITSFTHHPFYRQIPVEIPDNWEHALYYNVPLNEFMAIADYALLNGYTIGWDGDLTKDFSQANGLAVLPDPDPSKDEVEVTQEIRQKWFETFQTVDDHIMHITGIVKDQYGVKYYITKNSWGETGKLKGYVNMSENYFKAKCIAIMVHKDAIPKEIRKKLGI